MRFYCLELDFNFNSIRLAYILAGMGFTIYRRQFQIAYA